MRSTIILLTLLAMSCESKEKAHQKTSTPEKTQLPVSVKVCLLVMNPDSIISIEERQAIASCIEFNRFTQENLDQGEKNVLLNSIIPPVYHIYKSEKFHRDTILKNKKLNLTDKVYTMSHISTGADESPYEYITAAVRKKLGLRIQTEILPAGKLIETILENKYDMGICAISNNTNDPCFFLTDLISWRIIDTTELKYKEVYKDFDRAPDKKTRLEILSQIEKQLLEEYIVIPLYYEKY